jgi:hypothetical protein
VDYLSSVFDWTASNARLVTAVVAIVAMSIAHKSLHSQRNPLAFVGLAMRGFGLSGVARVEWLRGLALDTVRAKRMADELAGQMVGGWRIGASLGNGHSALVLVAKKGKQTVAALKIIDPEMVEQAGRDQQISRIMREKELAGHSHPHLVEILDGGECAQSGHLFVAMELLNPLTLDQVRNTLPRDRIAPLIAQLASAARFLEEREFCHRDIKPANVVVTPDFHRLKLLDLGVIRPYGDLTVNKRRSGTPGLRGGQPADPVRELGILPGSRSAPI